MAISKTVELKIKAIDDTQQGVSSIQSSMSRLESSLKNNTSITNNLSSKSVQLTGQLDSGINKVAGSYDKLNMKASKYESLLRLATQSASRLMGLPIGLDQLAVGGGAAAAGAGAGAVATAKAASDKVRFFTEAVKGLEGKLSDSMRAGIKDGGPIDIGPDGTVQSAWLTPESKAAILADSASLTAQQSQLAAATEAAAKLNDSLKETKKSLLDIDTSFTGIIKLTIAAAVAAKSVEIGFKGLKAIMASLDDDVEGAANAFVALGQSIKSIPVLGNMIESSGILDYIFQFERILEAERQMTETYKTRLELAKQTQQTLSKMGRRQQIEGFSPAGANLAGQLDSLANEGTDLSASKNAAIKRKNEAENNLNTIFQSITEKQGFQPFEDLQIQSKLGAHTAESLNLTPEAFEEMQTTGFDKLMSGRGLSTELRNSLANRFGSTDDLIKFNTGLAPIAGETQNIDSIDKTIVINDERKLELVKKFNEETKKTLADQIKSGALQSKSLEDQVRINDLVGQNKKFEADLLQVDIEKQNAQDQLTEAYVEQVKFIADRKKALQEAGQPTQDLADEEAKITSQMSKQLVALDKLSEGKRRQIMLAEELRKKEQQRQVRTDTKSAKLGFAESVLQDRAGAGDKDAESILRRLGFEKERAGLQQGLKTAIQGQLGLGTFTGGNKALELSKLFGDTLGFKFQDKKEFNDFTPLPSLVDRQQTTGVRESFMDGVDAARRNAQLAEMQKVSKNTAKTNKILEEIGLNAITLEER